MRTDKELDALNNKLIQICGKCSYFGKYAAGEDRNLDNVDADYIVECLQRRKDEVRKLLLDDGWEIVKESDFDDIEGFSCSAFCLKEKTKTYKVIYKETSLGVYFVDASSEEEALAKFEKASAEGEIDFSDMEINETETTVKEMKN